MTYYLFAGYSYYPSVVPKDYLKVLKKTDTSEILSRYDWWCICYCDENGFYQLEYGDVDRGQGTPRFEALAQKYGG